MLLALTGAAQTQPANTIQPPYSVYSGFRFPSIATQQDSLLVVLVDYVDMAFGHSVDTMMAMMTEPGYDSTGSFRDYFFNQSGGLFDPGIRVVRISVPDSINGSGEHAFDTMMFHLMDSMNTKVDLTHFANTGGNRPRMYPTIIYLPYAYEFDNGYWTSYYGQFGITDDNDNLVVQFGDVCLMRNGLPGNPPIGRLCYAFGPALGLPEMKANPYGTYTRQPSYFGLMDGYGLYSRKGHLANMSILEKYWLGWASFDTLEVGDSVSIKIINGNNDKGWYLPIDGDEFFMLEARDTSAYWDRHIQGYSGKGGMLVWHGKWSRFNARHHIDPLCISLTGNGCDVFDGVDINGGLELSGVYGDEGWYPVAAVGNQRPIVSGYSLEQVPFGTGVTPSNFTPLSAAKPMKNDSTLLDSIWITNIRWTSDTTMAFGYSKTRPNYTLVDNIRFNNGTDVTDSSFTTRALVVGYADTLLAKGIVYAATPEACTMEQGTVAYDTNLSQTDSVNVSVGGITPGHFWFRSFVQDSSGITLTAPQKVITPLVKIDSVVSYLDSIYPQDTAQTVYLDTVLTWYIPYVALGSNCTIIYTGSPENPDNIRGYYPTQANQRYDVDGPHGADASPERVLHAVSTDGDTVSYSFDLSTGAVMRETPIRYDTWLAANNDIYSINGNLMAARCMLTLPQEVASVRRVDMIAVVPDDTLQAWIEYYGPMSNNNSFIQHLQDYSIDTNFSLGDTAFLPTGDSTLVVIWDNAFGIKGYQLHASIIIAQDSTNESPGAYINPIPTGYRYCTDSTLSIDLWKTHHFSILYGKHSELTALGVTDTATAAAYCIAHPDQVARYEQYSIYHLTRKDDFSIDEDHIPDPEPAKNYFTNLANSDSGQYDLYIVPFDFEGHRGDIVHEQFTVLCDDMGIKIEPGISYLPYDTTWLHIEAGQTVWKWHYDWGWDLLYMPIDSMYSSVLLAGELDNIMATYGVGENGIMSLLRQQGRLSADDYLFNKDTTGLTTDTIYEVCLWVTMKNEETGWKDTLLVRRTFSTHVPADMLIKAKVIGIERQQSNGCWIGCNLNTAYVKTIFGTLEQLQNAGITGMAAARDYLESGGSPVQTLNIMGSGSTSSGDYCYTYANCNISSGQYYRLYAFPYSIDSIAGYGRMIGIDSRPESLPDCFTDPATDIHTTSANIHGHLSRSDYVFGDNYNGIRTKVGFFWREASASDFDTILVSEWDTTLNYTLTELEPNTEYVVRAFYDHYGNYFNGNWSWGDMTFYSQNEITFTTAQCTVSVSIDTAICYNAYYGNTHYTASQTLEYTYTAANGCDSVLTVNLTVLPQRIGHDTVVLCYGEEYDGAPRYTSVTLSETIHEEGLCDSTLSLRLEVLPQIETSVTDTLHGDTYEWGGEVLTEPGQYTQVFIAANGCDSTVHLTLVAESHEGIDDVSDGEISITVNEHIIVVSGVEGCLVTIYDVAGRKLATRHNGIHFEVPTAGTYLVRVGDQVARKVVVVR